MGCFRVIGVGGVESWEMRCWGRIVGLRSRGKGDRKRVDKMVFTESRPSKI